EVAVCLEKEDKLNFVTLVDEYNKVLTDVRSDTQTVGVTYNHCVDQEKVKSILLASNEAELKELREKNKGNRAEWEMIIAK
ncbi:hypothetical protein KI387_031652, partial [Taxus chinensis]